jgi:hypothetical protein
METRKPPENHGTPPGHGGTPPGQGGTPPGQGKPPEPTEPPPEVTEPPTDTQPEHPIVVPPEQPPTAEHPIVTPPEQPPTAEHPIVTPPPTAEHPIVTPPEQPPEPEKPPEVEPPPAAALSVEVTIDGTTHVFDMAAGIDKKNYVAPSAGFTQRCLRVKVDELPNFFIDFRPDIAGDRDEVVFWNGECLGDVPDGYAYDLPGYHAVIKKDGQSVHEEDVPQHAWGQRWRWCSSPRPVIRDAEQVFSEGWLLYMSSRCARIEGYSGIIVPPVPPAVPPYTTFRGPDPGHTDYKCGVQLAVDGGGERSEIGLVTEWQADWLLRGTQSSFDAMMTQAEMCAGDWNFYIPDQVTGCAVDYKQDEAHYRTNEYQQNHYGDYYQIKWGKMNGWDIHEAEAHLPNMWLVPYALTEDAYYLEATQFLLQYALGWGIYDREVTYGTWGTYPVCSYIGEIRTMGWGIRNLAIGYKCAPEDPPDWLQGKDYFAAVSADFSMIIERAWTQSDKPLHKVFRQLSNDNYWQAFMQAYAVMGMSLADLYEMPTGEFPTWKETLKYYFGFFTGICSGTSGWDRQAPQPHDIDSPDMNACADWTAAWEMVKVKYPMFNAYPDVPEPGNHQAGSMGNCSQITAACACAEQRGIEDAIQARDWMDEFVDFNYPSGTNEFGIPFYVKCGFE